MIQVIKDIFKIAAISLYIPVIFIWTFIEECIDFIRKDMIHPDKH